MRLFTIGDSLSQGFMSGAAARTDLSYSTMVARCLGAANYAYPDWPCGGHPVNLERLLRKLNRLYGSDVRGPFEWSAALIGIANFLDEIEECYERGERAAHKPLPNKARHFHNVAVRGFDLADAHLVTPRLCRQRIAADPGGTRDGFFATPGESFYRTAFDVLNPSRDPKFDDRSALDLLADHCADRHEKTGGVENLILWLGANNALGTMLDMQVNVTPADPAAMPSAQADRARYNLWHPDLFALEYAGLLDRVDLAMRNNKHKDWRVFVGTVPAVSVAPLAKGVGEKITMEDPFGVLKDGAVYFKYYTWFVFDEEQAHKNKVPKLNRDAVYGIDRFIARYNTHIRKQVAQLNRKHGQERYILVDICDVLLRAAYKRNAEQPSYAFPPALKSLVPMPNTKFYFANKDARVTDGGLFSLDGVHPSAIGQGILAHEFIEAMRAAGRNLACELDWPAIIASDSLWSQPISLMRELYQHEKLLEVIVRLLGKSGKKS